MNMIDDSVKPADALPFEAVEFCQTLQYALEQTNSATPVVNPAQCGLSLVDDDGHVSRLTLTDCPENRFVTLSPGRGPA